MSKLLDALGVVLLVGGLAALPTYVLIFAPLGGAR